MVTDECLILAAGKGTRMGPVGQRLPKILWPIFEQTILHLQIQYARKRGHKKIFLNTHFLSDTIHKKVIEENYSDIEISFEPDLLDSGGAIHNILKKCQGSYLTTYNGDQFYFFDKDILSSIDPNSSALLVSIAVPSNAGYNSLILENGRLLDILNEKNKNDPTITTYSGVGIINLSKLKFVAGSSKFFQTVADYKNSYVQVVTPTESEYWDFGTIDRYVFSMFKLLSCYNKKTNSKFLKLCLEHNVFNDAKVAKGSYGCSKDLCINLSENMKIDRGLNNEISVIMSSNKVEKFVENAIYFEDSISLIDQSTLSLCQKLQL